MESDGFYCIICGLKVVKCEPQEEGPFLSVTLLTSGPEDNSFTPTFQDIFGGVRGCGEDGEEETKFSIFCKLLGVTGPVKKWTGVGKCGKEMRLFCGICMVQVDLLQGFERKVRKLEEELRGRVEEVRRMVKASEVRFQEEGIYKRSEVYGRVRRQVLRKKQGGSSNSITYQGDSAGVNWNPVILITKEEKARAETFSRESSSCQQSNPEFSDYGEDNYFLDLGDGDGDERGPLKRKRGRPKKAIKTPEIHKCGMKKAKCSDGHHPTDMADMGVTVADGVDSIKRRRGRPSRRASNQKKVMEQKHEGALFPKRTPKKKIDDFITVIPDSDFEKDDEANAFTHPPTRRGGKGRKRAWEDAGTGDEEFVPEVNLDDKESDSDNGSDYEKDDSVKKKMRKSVKGRGVCIFRGVELIEQPPVFTSSEGKGVGDKEEAQYRCSKCSVVVGKSRIMRHVDQFHAYKKCNKCDAYLSMFDIRAHNRNVHRVQPCPICGKPDVLPPSYQRHVWSHLSKEEQSKVVSSAREGDGKVYAFAVKRNQCEECGFSSISLTKLLKHKLRVHGTEEERDAEKKVCALCGALVLDLKRHMIIHTDERKFKCDTCERSFLRKRELKKHRNIMHAVGESKKFECPQCPRKFHRVDDLKTHLNCHLNIRPFPCTECGMAFTRKQQMQRHMKTFHVEGAKPGRKSYVRGPQTKSHKNILTT